MARRRPWWLRNRLRTQPVRRSPRLLCEVLEDRATPTIFTVNLLGDAGTSTGTTTGDLRYCINQINADSSNVDDSIIFALNGTIVLGGSPLEITQTTGTVTIDATGFDIAVDGNGASTVFVVDNGVTASFAGVTIQNGNGGNGNGGGIDNEGTLTLTDCTVTTSTAGFGGGILNDEGCSLSVINSTISGNTANFDGAGIENDGTLQVTGSTISGNACLSGQGESFGGGIDNNVTATVTDSTLTGNTASFGAGIDNTGIQLSVTYCTITGNTADTAGGGIETSNSPLTLSASIVSVNTAPTGPDIDTSGILPEIGTGNDGPPAIGVNDTTGPITDNGYNLLGTALDGQTVGTGDIFSDAPLLAPLGAYGGPTETMALLSGSPAIDAGDPATTSADQRGEPVFNNRRDIGAFESQGFTLTITGGNNQSTPADGSPFPDPLVVTVTANDPNVPVQGGIVTFTPPASGATAVITGSPATVQKDGTATVTAASDTTSGSYTIPATMPGAPSPANFSLTNTPLPQTIDFTISPPTVTYGNAPITLSATGGGSGNPVTFTVISGPGTLNGDVLTITGTGAIVVEANQAGNAQYSAAAPVDQTLTINPAVLDILPDVGQSKVYGAAIPTLTFTASGFVNGDSITGVTGALGTVATTASPVGSYAFTLGSLADPNYTLELDPASPTFAVTPATLDILPTAGQSKVYGAAVPTLTYTPSGLVNGDTNSVFSGSLGTIATSASPVGDYAFTLGTLAAGPNYTLQLDPASPTFAVTPATLDILPTAGQSKVYGAAVPSLTYTASGFVNGDTAAGLTGALGTVATSASPVGDYAFTLGTLADGPNYTLQLDPASPTFAVTPATLDILPTAGQSKVYGAAVPTLAYTPSGFVNGDTVAGLTGALGTVATSASPVGNYAFALGTLADANYTLALDPASPTFAVTPATLTIFPTDGQSKVYGAPVPTLTYTVSGFVNGDPQSILVGALGTVATESSPVGDYAFTLGTLTAGPNYSLVLDVPTFAVTPAPLTIQPDAGQSKVYGAAVPTLTYTVSGLVNGDTSSIVTGALGTDATSASPVGDDTFTLGTLAADSNYTLALGGANVSFAVTPAPLTVTANNATRYVDQANPAFTASYSGFVNGDGPSSLGGTLAFSTTAVGSSSPAGTYPITPSGLTSPNYTIQYVNGTLTVVSVLNPTVPLVAVGAGPGGGPRVEVFNPDGSLRFNFFAYDSSFRSGVSVATADVNGDGTDDIITGTGDGGGPEVEVFDGVTGQQILAFFAYDTSFRGGVWVSAGEVNGRPVIVTGAGTGGAPIVRLFDASTGVQIGQFVAGDVNSRGGVRVAFADDAGRPVIVTGAGPGEVATESVYDASTFQQLSTWQPYEPSFTGGIYVAAGENVDGSALIATGPGFGGGPRLELSNTSGDVQQNIFASTNELRNGLTVAIMPPPPQTGTLSVLTGAGNGVLKYTINSDGTITTGTPFAPFEPSFQGGVFVG
ncbi:beta strand repeat-containing protein [Fimbriiglobus ruber]|uniref:MBG domain-containing protein n=1 Tax=Fimbriiglobus ruber TaxID=1908690 RepID=A0A225DNY9_9BACT|nr:MBG domain-containing protein [Fimbriiglobus ruber]OWK43180.1 hypothetical protein FRUB_02779 [Fimbriiglobus ruber]